MKPILLALPPPRPMGSTRPRRPSGLAGLLFCAWLLAAANPGLAQEQEPAAPATPAPGAEPPPVQLTNALPATEQAGQTNDLGAVVELIGAAAAAAETNAQAEAGDTNGPPDQARGVYDPRQARGERFARERRRNRFRPGASAPAGDASTNGPASLDYSAFRVIAELNIFDPNRQPRQHRGPETPPSEFFRLVGTMSYEKGTFAFFSGSASQYEKALKLADSIAGFKLTNISADAVKLSAGTNQVELQMGMVMRREQAGPWYPSAAPVSGPSPGATAGATSTSESAARIETAAPGGGESETLKRLRERRERE